MSLIGTSEFVKGATLSDMDEVSKTPGGQRSALLASNENAVNEGTGLDLNSNTRPLSITPSFRDKADSVIRTYGQVSPFETSIRHKLDAIQESVEGIPAAVLSGVTNIMVPLSEGLDTIMEMIEKHKTSERDSAATPQIEEKHRQEMEKFRMASDGAIFSLKSELEAMVKEQEENQKKCDGLVERNKELEEEVKRLKDEAKAVETLKEQNSSISGDHQVTLHELEEARIVIAELNNRLAELEKRLEDEITGKQEADRTEAMRSIELSKRLQSCMKGLEAREQEYEVVRIENTKLKKRLCEVDETETQLKMDLEGSMRIISATKAELVELKHLADASDARANELSGIVQMSEQKQIDLQRALEMSNRTIEILKERCEKTAAAASGSQSKGAFFGFSGGR